LYKLTVFPRMLPA